MPRFMRLIRLSLESAFHANFLGIVFLALRNSLRRLPMALIPGKKVGYFVRIARTLKNRSKH